MRGLSGSGVSVQAVEVRLDGGAALGGVRWDWVVGVGQGLGRGARGEGSVWAGRNWGGGGAQTRGSVCTGVVGVWGSLYLTILLPLQGLLRTQSLGPWRGLCVSAALRQIPRPKVRAGPPQWGSEGCWESPCWFWAGGAGG